MGEEGLGRWALIGYNGATSILISNEIYIMSYMEACSIAEKIANELGLECGMAISMNSVWEILIKSAKSYNQEIF